MLTLLTATGSRPDAWALCERWMARQTYLGEVRWVIVDDGPIPQPITFAREGWTLDVIRPEPLWTGDNTQARNLMAGMAVIKEDERVVFIEDDDWYAPDWLEFVAAKLALAELVGEANARYYNLKTSVFKEMGNTLHSSLCSTAIRGRALSTFRSVCRKEIQFIDHLLWQAHSNSHLFSGQRVLGIKGLPGRNGIGIGHDPKFRGETDQDGAKLRDWIGEDADAYLTEGKQNDASKQESPTYKRGDRRAARVGSGAPAPQAGHGRLATDES